jgi:hypothetical protein
MPAPDAGSPVLRSRIALTVLWLGALTAALVLVESYQHARVNNIQILLPEDREAIMTQLSYLFGPYLVGILGFWYTQPFPAQPTDKARRARFLFALVCTSILIGVVLYFVAYVHLFGTEGGTVLSNVKLGVKIAGLFSFLVAPVNLYYFGMKVK